MKTRDVTYCAVFTALMAIGSKISIPLPSIGMHFTLQWLFILLASLLLEKKNACISVATYLLLGLIGLPVFASGGGIGYLLKPTFGFLLGFLIATFVMVNLPQKDFIKTLLGLCTYYGFGFVYYYFMMTFFYQQPLGIWIAIVNCFTTFIPDLFLCILACEIKNKICLSSKKR